MRLTEHQLYDALARIPFIDTLELAVILGEAYATVHRALSGLLADGIAGRVNHGTVHLPTSGRWFLTTEGIDEAAASWASQRRPSSCGLTRSRSSG